MVTVFDTNMTIAHYRIAAFLICGILAGTLPGQGWSQEETGNTTVSIAAKDEPIDQPDLFLGLQSLPAEQMSQFSGGSETSFGDVGLNLATNSSSLIGNSVDGNVETGKIQDLNLNDIGGINTMMFNTGNNVNFQSNMQINIFIK